MPRAAKYNRQVALDKAVKLFWTKGYHTTSLKDLEKALDMRPGSLYAAFGSKQQLFVEALDDYTRQMAVQLQVHLVQQASPLDALKIYLRDTVLNCSKGMPHSRACMIIKTLLEVGERDEPLRTKVNELLNRMEETFELLLREAQEKGELRPELDCSRLAGIVQIQMMGFRTFAQRDVSETRLAQLLDDIFALLDGYRMLH